MRLPGRALNQIYCASITKVICQWLLIPGKFPWFYIRGSHAWSFSALGKFENRLKESRGTKEMLWILGAKQWKRKRKEAEKGERKRERERMCINHILCKNSGLDSKAWIFTKQFFIVMLCNISYTLCWWTAKVKVSYVSSLLWDFRYHWVVFTHYAVYFEVAKMFIFYTKSSSSGEMDVYSFLINTRISEESLCVKLPCSWCVWALPSLERIILKNDTRPK